MPDLQAFNGIRYSLTENLRDLVCPPYDVISLQEQVRLHDRHPNNAVRLELPFSEHPDEPKEKKYLRAAEYFDEWLETEVLGQDQAPSLYVYRQDFIGHDGRRKRVTGVIGALRLEPLGAATGILPHERTMPGPIEDRLTLLRSCPVNISPIYAIYRGAGSLAPFLESLESRPAAARFSDDHGALHRIWVITDPAEVELLSASVRAGPLVIADGHHRYETALAFHAEQDEPGEHDFVMCFCVDADAEDLEVLPYNRALRATVPPDELAERLTRDFGARAIEPSESSAALEQSGADHPLLFILPERALLVEVSDKDVVERVGQRARSWRALDVVALHEVVLPQALSEGIDELSFSNHPEEVVDLVHSHGWTAAVLLRPLQAAEVIEVARSGERMPQKASYFWPKVVTGLVFRSLR